jgi:TPR repeat protein
MGISRIFTRLFVAAFVLSLSALTSARADFYTAEGLLAAGDRESAVLEYRRAGLSGDLFAQKKLGDLYVDGIFVLQDYAEAHMWYTLAVINPDIGYRYDEEYAPTYYETERRPSNPERAEPRVQKRSDVQREALRRRARLQTSMTQDEIERARRKFVRVLEWSGVSGVSLLAGLYQTGVGVSQPNRLEAYRYSVIASAEGDEQAIDLRDQLSKFLNPEQINTAQKRAREWSPPPSPFEDEYDGTPLDPVYGTPRDLAPTLSVVQYALKALFLYKGPTGGHMNQGTRDAIKAFQASIDAQATGTLTTIQTVRLVERAARQGNDRVSQNALGNFYARGYGKPQNLRLARVWYQESAQQGDASGNFNLAVLYRDGIGVPRDNARAKSYFLEAKRRGHPRALRALRDLEQNGNGKSSRRAGDLGQ